MTHEGETHDLVSTKRNKAVISKQSTGFIISMHIPGHRMDSHSKGTSCIMLNASLTAKGIIPGDLWSP